MEDHMPEGYAGKVGFVDLTSDDIKIEKLDEATAREYIG